MVGHDDVGIELQLLMFLAIADAVIENIHILLPGEDVYPTDHRGGGVIQLTRPGLVAGGHGVKIRLFGFGTEDGYE